MEPPENNSNSDRVRLGSQPEWGGGWEYATGLRFTGVAVPQGANITAAWLSFKYKYHTGMPVNVHIWGETADDSQPFTDDHTLAHLRPHTVASVAWNMDAPPEAGAWFDTPDIAPLVQEIVIRPGWSTYHAFSILIESDPGTDNNISAWAYDTDPLWAARVEVCYDAGGDPVNTATPTPTSRWTPTATPTSRWTPTPTPTATPTSVPPTATPTRPPSPGTKQGLTWTYSSSISTQKIAAAGAKAVHHWGYDATKALAAINNGLVYYPMQFGCSQGAASVDETAIRAFINASPTKLKGLTWLAFNEPELAEQANCTPQQAAQALHKLDQVLRRGSNPADSTAKLYCCGTVHSSIGTVYLQDFEDAYRSEYGGAPPIDGVHIHLYWGESGRLDWCRLRNHLDNFRSWQQGQAWMAGKPVVVSEWGVLSNSDDHPDDPQYMTGNCTPGCTCDIMGQMWNAFEERSYVRHHLWWTAYVNEYWNNGNVFTNQYGTQLTDPVGLRYRQLSTGG